jgi:CheY-like chemotaxis protein
MRKAHAPRLPEAIGVRSSAASGTILVIDDNQDICSFITAALEPAGYEVRTASEGGQALALLRRRPADLLITDLFMPGQEGFETISRCRAEFPQTRIIVISAGTVPGMMHDYLATAELLGVAATLRKPFDAETLLGKVRSVLQHA